MTVTFIKQSPPVLTPVCVPLCQGGVCWWRWFGGRVVSRSGSQGSAGCWLSRETSETSAATGDHSCWWEKTLPHIIYSTSQKHVDPNYVGTAGQVMSVCLSVRPSLQVLQMWFPVRFMESEIQSLQHCTSSWVGSTGSISLVTLAVVVSTFSKSIVSSCGLECILPVLDL